MSSVRQCKSCPWRVACAPLTDIPHGYNVELHKKLSGTIATPGDADKRIMACHYSPVGAERACAGWLFHQLGVGNNIWLRLALMRGTMPVPEIDGEQHQTFEDTLPTG